MKKKLNIIMAFLFLIASEQSLAKNVTLGPGSEVTTGRVLSSKWINYQITNDRFIGNLEVRVRLVRVSFGSPFNYSAPYNLPPQGSSVNIVACPSRDGGYSFACHTVPLVVRCNSADKGDINVCMNRIVGTEETIIIPIDQPKIGMDATTFCIRDYLKYADVRNHQTDPLMVYFEPYTICGAENGAPPPIPELTGSVCSLNSQQIELSYQSTTTNVSGLRKDGALSVLCTSGTPQNYQLKLTGNNVTNGKLNFGNGVSAQVSLNGSQVQANGPGIKLNSLTSQAIPVSATLTGNASVSGVSKATGILVLEAL